MTESKKIRLTCEQVFGADNLVKVIDETLARRYYHAKGDNGYNRLIPKSIFEINDLVDGRAEREVK